MRQRHEHLPPAQTPIPNDLLDRGVSSRIAVFVFESIEDAAGNAALIAVNHLVALQDLVDYLQEGRLRYCRRRDSNPHPVARTGF